MIRIIPWLAFVTACSEYNYKTSDDVRPGPDEEDETGEPDVEDSDPPVGDDCPDAGYAGYVGSTDADCANEIETGTFTPTLKYAFDTWSVDPSSNQVMMAPIVVSLTDDDGDGDIDEDDMPDIVVTTYGSGSYGNLRAVHGDGSGEIFNVVGTQLQLTGAVAGGDIDGDGIVEIIACTSNTVKAYEHDGTLKWTSASLAGHMYGTSDAPAISDMDGDGNPEIIVGNAILKANGEIRGLGSLGMGATDNVGTTSFAVDLDADGTQELITGNAAYDPDGNVLWSNGESDGYVAVADFDSDGQGETIVMRAGKVRLQDTDGTVLWRAAISGASAGYGGPPTIADFDGDGAPEVGVAGQSNYTVFDTDGTKLWERSTTDASSGNTGSSVFDFEGDGVAEAVYADETKLWVFSGPDGSIKLQSDMHSNATWTEYPTIADVDADGHADIVVANTAYTKSHSGFYVFEDADNSWRAGRRIWNQHAYHITNVNDDGTIPAVAELNWLEYNNFRSGDLGAGNGTSAPDLTPAQAGLCEVDCDEGRIIVYVQVGNVGAQTAEAGAYVYLYGESGGAQTLLAETTLTAETPAGWYNDSIEFDLAGFDPSAWDALAVEVVPLESECDAANNTVRWEGPFCD